MNGKMEFKQLYALGVGHNTPVFVDLAEQCGYNVLGLYHYNDERTGEEDHGLRILGSFDDLFSKNNLARHQNPQAQNQAADKINRQKDDKRRKVYTGYNRGDL